VGRGTSFYVGSLANGAIYRDDLRTGDAAYFTDSSQPVIYRLPLGPGGALPDASAIEQIPLSGDFVFVPGAFNANGIEATSSGKMLLVVHSSRGELFRVDGKTGRAKLVDLGNSSLTNGDGLRWLGKTLYVVRNRLNPIEAICLAPDLASGEVIHSITNLI
jgi:sugar lactone lactonase YvrE